MEVIALDENIQIEKIQENDLLGLSRAFLETAKMVMNMPEIMEEYEQWKLNRQKNQEV